MVYETFYGKPYSQTFRESDHHFNGLMLCTRLFSKIFAQYRASWWRTWINQGCCCQLKLWVVFQIINKLWEVLRTAWGWLPFLLKDAEIVGFQQGNIYTSICEINLIQRLFGKFLEYRVRVEKATLLIREGLWSLVPPGCSAGQHWEEVVTITKSVCFVFACIKSTHIYLLARKQWFQSTQSSPEN